MIIHCSQRKVKIHWFVVDVYVDDVLVTGNNEQEILNLKRLLHKRFQIEDLGMINLFLGLEFIHTHDGIIMHQYKYIKELLVEYFVSSSSQITSPLPSKLKSFYTNDDPLVDATSNRQSTGKLNFLLHTRPNIAFIV